MNRRHHPLIIAAAVAIASAGLFAGANSFGALRPAVAQDAPAAGAPHQRYGQMLLSLNLTDAQKAQIRDIIGRARQQNASVTDPQVKRSNMRAAFATVRTVLTPGQRSKLDAEMQQARAARPGGSSS